MGMLVLGFAIDGVDVSCMGFLNPYLHALQ